MNRVWLGYLDQLMAWVTGDRWVGLTRVRYSGDFVALFKETIRVRAWDPETKTWWFPRSAAPIVERLLDDCGIEHPAWVEMGEPHRRHQGMFTLKPSPYSVLGCREDADDVVLKAAYRALAKKHHPDSGGDSEIMKLVNAAWAEVAGNRGL